MRNISICPICYGNKFTPFLTCEDFTVTHETFTIIRCSQCAFLVTSPTPDLDHLGHYYKSDAYISHAANASTVEEKLYRLARSFTLSWKLRLISKRLPGSSPSTILDYGCGTGQFLRKCQTKGWKIQGIEPSEHARQQSAALTQTQIPAVLDLAKHSGFDVITLWHVLEHVVDLNETIQNLKLALTDAGTMFIAVPNPNCWDAAHYRHYWAGYDLPRHLWHFSQSNMATLMKNNGLRIIRTQPMKLDAFYISLLSEKYQKQRTSLEILIAALVNGFKSNHFATKQNDYSSLIYIVQK